MLNSEHVYFYRAAASPDVQLAGNEVGNQRYRCGADAGEWEISYSWDEVRWDVPDAADPSAPKKIWLIQPGEDAIAVSLSRPGGNHAVVSGEWFLVPLDRTAEETLDRWLSGISGLTPDLRLVLTQALRQPGLTVARTDAVTTESPSLGAARGRRMALTLAALVILTAFWVVRTRWTAQQPADSALAALRQAIAQSPDAALRPLAAEPAGFMTSQIAQLDPPGAAAARDAVDWAYCSTNFRILCSPEQAGKAEATYRKWEILIRGRR